MIRDLRPTPSVAVVPCGPPAPGSARHSLGFPLVRALLLMLAVAGFAAVAPAAAQSCSCEHFGDQYDGLCEATPEQEYYYNDPSFPTYRYEWVPIGYAYFPQPVDPFSGFAYYDCPPGRSCGLRMRLYFRWPPTTPGGEELVGQVTCIGGTGGG
jgi:hypothetical protein